MFNVEKGPDVRRIGLIFGLGFAAVLTACGGGGGSAGDTQLEYKITLRADKTQLPVNIAGAPASTGTYAPYTTVLYVNATEGGKPVLGSDEQFACNIEAGLDAGSLYYLDGDEDHEDDEGNPLAYRNIVLDSNSGGDSFHFHAGPTAGTARIVCTITNPRDNQVSSASVNVVVGPTSNGNAGMPTSVNVQAPGSIFRYIGSKNNANSIRNNVALQAMLRDQTNQWVADPSVANLQISIVSGTAAAGARLISDSGSGSIVQTSTRNGVADFSLSSGPQRGVILLALVTDRADNNVANGIQDPIRQLLAIPVVHAIAEEPLAMTPQAIATTCNKTITQALVATGGVAPYTWEVIGGLPEGLTLSPSGIVSGIPASLNGTNAGTYTVVVRVTDAEEASVTGNFTVTVDAGDCQPLKIVAPDMAATVGQPFVYALSAEGGKPPYKWRLVAGSGGFTLSEAGILSGTSGIAGTFNQVVEVTDADGIVVTGNVLVTVAEPEVP